MNFGSLLNVTVSDYAEFVNYFLGHEWTRDYGRAVNDAIWSGVLAR